MKFEETTTTERWLILSDANQKFPTGELIVDWAGERASKTNPEKKNQILILSDEEGNKYTICVWKRDVIECINQYGSDTEQWNGVKFELKNGRMQLVPTDLKVKVEVMV